MLSLNADFAPLKVIRWEEAVEKIVDQKAIAVENYDAAFVRSARLVIPWPAVVALRKYRTIRGRVKFSASNVAARDRWTCCYCGVQPRLLDGRPDRSALTLDHVIPRAHAEHATVYVPWAKAQVNVTSWLNSLCSCKSCNARKGDRTPSQAGMHMLSIPRTPTQNDVMRMHLARMRTIPAPWRAYIPGLWDEPVAIGEAHAVR